MIEQGLRLRATGLVRVVRGDRLRDLRRLAVLADQRRADLGVGALLLVIDGMGFVSGAGGERIVSRGDLVTYEPNEPHGMRAASNTLVLLAVIAPRPGVRVAAEPVALAMNARA